MDKIHIRNLRLRTHVGIYDWEQDKRQDVILNITLHHDQKAAAVSDKVEDTTDYKSLKTEIVAFIEAGHFGLIERVAEEVAAMCLAKDGVQGVDVTVDKPQALRFADSVAVEIHRP